MGYGSRYTHGLGPGNTPVVPTPVYPGYTHPACTRTCLYPHCAWTSLLNAIAFLSKLAVVDIRFTVSVKHARVNMPVVNMPVVNMPQEHAKCAYFPNRSVINEVS